MPLNLAFLILNIIGLALTAMGFLPYFESFKVLFLSLGFSLLAFTTVGLIFFKGKMLMALVSRVLVGSVFIVSGLIKLNDPIGFAYKLEEYFQDGALAYRIKEWFGAPGFSLEYLIPYALGIGIFLCVLEIVLGVLLMINGKARIATWLYMLLMVFFTFLTWHTAACNPKAKFTDQDTYAMDSPMAISKIEESKTNQLVKIISKDGGKVVVEEEKTPQCVTDCGCFGDAFKDSIGRSLTPTESFWKDLILLYLGLWIFLAQKHLRPNTVSQNWRIFPISMLIIAALSWVVDWYFPILFAAVAFLAALWIYKSSIPKLNNHYGSILILIGLCVAFVWYNLRYDPIKDYRPWKVGTYLPKRTTDGYAGKIITMVQYKHVRNGKIREYDAMGKDYQNSNIWDNPDWKYFNTVQKTIVPNRLASIDTLEFNPSKAYSKLDAYELDLPFVTKLQAQLTVPGLRIKDVHTNEIEEIEMDAYNVESYPTEIYSILDTIQVKNEDLQDVSVRDYIFTAPQVIVVVAKKLKEFNPAAIGQLQELCAKANKAKIPVILLSSNDENDLNAFKRKHQLNLAAFSNDETTLKAITRSNPGYLFLEYGWVKGKYTTYSLPTFGWIQKNIFK